MRYCLRSLRRCARASLIVVMVAGACSSGCLTGGTTAAEAASPLFNQVAGSPFATDVGDASSVAFSPGGELLATANTSNTVSVLSVAANGALTPVPGSPFETGSPQLTHQDSVVFSPSGAFVATVGYNIDDNTGDAWISVFSVADDGTLTPVPGSPFAAAAGAASVAFSPNGKLLVTAAYYSGDGGALSVYSVAADGTLTQVDSSPYALGDTAPVSIAFSPSGGLLAAADNGRATGVSLFSVAGDGTLSQVAGPDAADTDPNSVAFGPDGLLASTGYNPNGGKSRATVSLFSVTADGTLTPVASPQTLRNAAASTAFSPDGGLLATGSSDGTVSVFSVAASGALRQVAGSPLPSISFPEAVAFSPNDGVLAAAGFDYSQSYEGGSVATYSAADPAISFPPSDPSVVADGGTFTETVTLTNEGAASSAATGMALSLPPSRSGVTAIGLDGGQREGRQVSWRVAALSPGNSISHTVTFQATSDATGPISLVGVTSATSTDFDRSNDKSALSIRLSQDGGGS